MWRVHLAAGKVPIIAILTFIQSMITSIFIIIIIIIIIILFYLMKTFFPVLYIDANNLYGSVQTQRYVDLIIIIIFTNQKNHMIIIIIIVNA